MFVCVCIYIYIYIYIYIHIYIYICIFICIFIHILLLYIFSLFGLLVSLITFLLDVTNTYLLSLHTLLHFSHLYFSTCIFEYLYIFIFSYYHNCIFLYFHTFLYFYVFYLNFSIICVNDYVIMYKLCE